MENGEDNTGQSVPSFAEPKPEKEKTDSLTDAKLVHLLEQLKLLKINCEKI